MYSYQINSYQINVYQFYEWIYCCLVSKSCPALFLTLWTAAHQAPLSMTLPSQESWSGFPFLSPGHLLSPGIEPVSSVWQLDSLPLSHLGSLNGYIHILFFFLIYFYFILLYNTYSFKNIYRDLYFKNLEKGKL